MGYGRNQVYGAPVPVCTENMAVQNPSGPYWLHTIDLHDTNVRLASVLLLASGIYYL